MKSADHVEVARALCVGVFGGYRLSIRLSVNPLVIARSVEQDTADSGVEPVTQFYALGFAQGVFVERFARELQKWSVYLRR